MTPEMISYAVAALLLVAMFWDCKFGKIPNWLILVMIAVYAVSAVLVGPFDYWQIIVAVLIFVGGFGLFAIGAFGAGAVKLIGATALFMPLDRLGTLGLILLAGVILGLFLFGALRSMLGSEDSAWSVLRKRVIPMAVPIGVAGLCGLFIV